MLCESSLLGARQFGDGATKKAFDRLLPAIRLIIAKIDRARLRQRCRHRYPAPFLAVPVILWLLTGLTRTERMALVAAVAVASLANVFRRRVN